MERIKKKYFMEIQYDIKICMYFSYCLHKIVYYLRFLDFKIIFFNDNIEYRLVVETFATFFYL